MNYRADIDGLRAVAVLGVVLCHADLLLTGGYVGVDVFFVISGFLITRLMLKDLDRGTFSIATFWERRIRRIMPALTVVVAASFCAGWFLFIPPTYHLFGRAVVNLAILQANTFYANQINYFSPATEELPLLHTWSLAVEEQFYLFAPLAFWLVMRFRRQWLGGVIATVAVVSFVWCAHGVGVDEPKTYFRLTARCWELLAGCLIATRRPTWPARRPALCEAAAWLGLACIVGPFVFYDKHTPFPGFAALPPTLGAVLLIVTGEAGLATRLHRFLGSRPVRGVGLISYSLYLWHWPILIFYKASRFEEPGVPERLALVGLSFVLATLSYFGIEQPFRTHGAVRRRRLAFVGAGATFACLMLGGEWLKSTDGMVARVPQHDCFPPPSFVTYPARNTTVAGIAEPVVRLGPDDGEPELVLWGDSHAMAIIPAVDDVCRTRNLPGICCAALGRPPLLEYRERSDRRQLEHKETAAALVEYVRTARIRVVLLAAYWQRYAGDPRFNDDLPATIDALRDAGAQVYIMKTVPTFNFDVRARLMRAAWTGVTPPPMSLTLSASPGAGGFIAGLEQPLTERHVRFIEPTQTLLDRNGGREVIPFDDGGVLYADSNHLTEYGALALRPAFFPLVDDAVAAARPTSPSDEPKDVRAADAAAGRKPTRR